MIKVNLVPGEILAKAKQRQQVLQAAAAGVCLLVVVAGVSFGHWWGFKRLEAKLAEDMKELKKLEVIVAKVEELERTVNAVRARLNVINDLLKGRAMYPYFMSDLARSVPGGVRIRTLMTAGGGSTATPLKLTITAESRTNEDIAAWTRKMEESGRFSTIELGGVTTGAERMSLFTMTVIYTPSL